MDIKLTDKETALIVSALRTATKQLTIEAGQAYRKINNKGTSIGDACLTTARECSALAERLTAPAEPLRAAK